MKYIAFLCILELFSNEVVSFSGEIVSYSEISRCENGEYFDSILLKCTKCDEKQFLRPALEKLSCTCMTGSKLVRQADTGFHCKPCPAGQRPTQDGLDCVSCGNQSCSICPSGSIQIDRGIDGRVQTPVCVECATGWGSSPDGQRCEPCGYGADCPCPNSEESLGTGLGMPICAPRSALAEWPNERATYTVEFLNGLRVESSFLRALLRPAVFLCLRENRTSCQVAANLCTLLLYSDHTGSPCRLFHDSRSIPSRPWLLYGDGEAQTVLTRRKIGVVYQLNDSPNGMLNVSIVRFSATGRLIGISEGSLESLTLCPGTWGALGIARFGRPYFRECQIPVSALVSVGRRVEFLEPYLRYWEPGSNGGPRLHAIPVLVLNVGANRESDRAGWMMARRFFLAEALTGSPLTTGPPSVIRYARSVHVRVWTRGTREQGMIFPPLLEVEYAEVAADSYRDTLVRLELRVSWSQDAGLARAVSVAVSTLSALALLWSGLRALSQGRRAGLGVDPRWLGRLALLACGRLADVFFLVVACASVHALLFYKGQTVPHSLLPGSDDERLIFNYVIAAFSLKVVEVAHLLWQQVTIDIFLLDWERPRAGSQSSQIGPQPVSIWRTYFVANEWNEMQTRRKTSLGVQLLLLLLCLKIFGWEQWAVPNWNALETSPPNPVCRFALGVLVYLGLYITQWILRTGIYERYIKNFVQDFVDVCSMANVSVFILSLENFGYYIHGRSAHGFADTDMQTMLGQLQREEDDLVGHRGLLPDSEQQTFRMLLPPALRTCYRRVLAPLAATQHLPVLAHSGGLSLRRTSAPRMGQAQHAQQAQQAYHSINRLLSAFLEHALKDLDYEVRAKLFLEAVLDMEFAQAQDKGVFYIDNGHSFDAVLFYGNEWVLLTFDLILFTFTEMLCGDYLLAAIVTGLAAQLLVVLRRFGGRKNLAKKTLIDERFLI